MRPAEAASTFHADVTKLIPALKLFARRFCREQSGQDDLVQETLLKAFANADKFQHGTNLKSWLFTIMRNTFCTMYGQSKREFVGGADSVDIQPSVDPTQEWVARGKEFQRELLALPDHYRLAFNLIFIDGVSYEDAAQRSGCPIGTVKSRVSRARAQLADRLSG
ncbi:MAG TPA: sigma-70 family RNA polymerase sigma factor [Pseudorhizobium sp.]|nr:sigma-70 family RNA polymerase sigma factor [Pseudorhizobium sp.]